VHDLFCLAEQGQQVLAHCQKKPTKIGAEVRLFYSNFVETYVKSTEEAHTSCTKNIS